MVPGGSWNANASDLNGSKANYGCTNVLRGTTIDKEIILFEDVI